MASRIIFLAALVVIVMLPMAAPAQEPAFNWTGFYVGIQGLYGTGNTDWNYTNGSWIDNRANHQIDGGMGGIYAGYNYQFPNKIVIGAELEGNGGIIAGSTPDNAGVGGWRAHSEINWIASARGRLGYVLYERFLPFVTVGGAGGGVNIYTEDPRNHTYGSLHGHFGWTAGAGIEYSISTHFRIRAEYSYYDFGSHHSTVDNGNRVRHDVRAHVGKIGISYNF
jgi:outer membrane immunogenic protein